MAIKNISKQHFQKKPTPSETRWSFYRDVLKSLLSQEKQIDQFLLQDAEFPSAIQKMKPLFDSVISPAPPSFSNEFVNGHFHFAYFLLDKMSILNNMMQEEDTVMPVLWESILKLKEDMSFYLDEINHDCFDSFDFISSPTDSQKKTFKW